MSGKTGNGQATGASRREDEAARVEAVVQGRVQGVGYRAFVAREAQAAGLLGWVRNEPGGAVRLVAEGRRGNIERFLDAIHVGPALARVARIDETWTAPQDLHGGFEVRR